MRFALAGNQNCGKTTLFNQLTGSNQHVGNFPGVTVDSKSGSIRNTKGDEVVDLPGIYSLRPYSAEEIVTRDFILDGHLNNCLYLRWGQDLLPEEFARTHTLRSVWIEYRKELPRGTESELTYSLSGSTLYVRGTAENKERFLLRMEYDETV